MTSSIVPTPLALMPTLMNIASFSVTAEPPAEPPALAPIPAAVTTAVAVLLDHASAAISPEEVAVANALRFPLASFIEDEDEDLELDDFFSLPKSKGKGKASAPPPPPTAKGPPKGPATTASSPATGSSAIAGPSSSVHPFLKRMGYVEDKPLKGRVTVEDVRSITKNVATVAMGAASLSDELSSLRTMLAEGFEGVNAQLIGFAAETAEASRAPAHPTDAQTIASIISASNKNAENAVAMGAAFNDVISRTRKLESASATASAVTALQAQVESQGRTMQVMITRMSGMAGSAPAAPTAAEDALFAAAPVSDDARLRAMIQELLNDNGKRGREGDDNDHAAAKRVQLAVIPQPFVYPAPPPAPAFASPAFEPAPSMIAYPVPPPAPPQAFPRPPPGGPPRVKIDPTREVLLGPMTWQGNCHSAPRNLVTAVLGVNTMRSARFTSRKGPDDFTAVLVFEADTVASWFVTTWNEHVRAGYEVCVARAMPLNV
ncbi:hypothetical protein DFH09DRAFT_1352534 [Mycena vulgaris]|nr:hypothetical protein DFH09DRAFT_1352534 [Mycena vulgaris]